MQREKKMRDLEAEKVKLHEKLERVEQEFNSLLSNLRSRIDREIAHVEENIDGMEQVPEVAAGEARALETVEACLEEVRSAGT